MKFMTRFVTVLAGASALALTACNGETADSETATEAGAEVSTETLSALIADGENLDTVKDLMNDAGLADAFDGNAPYTVFAPTDDALASLGEDFQGEQARPAMLAVLREHIVPGYLTLEDIGNAIDQGEGSVEMQTMGEGKLTFTRQGEAIMVAPSGGSSSATLTNAMQGANGVVYAVDTVLKDVAPAT